MNKSSSCLIGWVDRGHGLNAKDQNSKLATSSGTEIHDWVDWHNQIQERAEDSRVLKFF